MYCQPSLPPSLPPSCHSDLIKVQDGIGDKFSISVQLVCNFIFGYVVGFEIEWRLALFMLGCAPLLVGASFIFTKASGLGKGLLGCRCRSIHF